MWSMNSSVCTKELNLKKLYMVVKYKLNTLPNSTNISNARALTPQGPRPFWV